MAAKIGGSPGRFGLTYRLTIVLLAVSLVPTIGGTYYVISQSQSNIRNSVMESQASAASAMGDNLANWATNLITDAKIMSMSQDVYEACRPIVANGGRYSPSIAPQVERATGAFATNFVTSRGYNEFSVAAPDGKLAYSTVASHIGADVLQRPYVQAALAKNVGWSGIFYSTVANTTICNVAVPVYSGRTSGSVIGVVVLVAFTTDLSKLVQNQATVAGSTGDAFLIGGDGLLLTDSAKGAFSKDAALKQKSEVWAADAAFMKAIAAGDTKFVKQIEYKNVDGRPVLGTAAVVNLGMTPAGVVLEVDSAEAFASVYRMRTTSFIFDGLLAVVVLAISLFFSRQLVRPLKDTVTMLRDVAEGSGDLTARLKALTKDEIGDVAENFNKFIAKIAGIIRDVSESADSVELSSGQLAEAASQAGTAANQVGAAVSQIAAGNSEQDKTAEALNGLMEQLNASIQEINNEADSQAGAVERVQQAMAAMAEALQRTNDIVTQASENMEKTQGAAQEGTRTVKETGRGIQQIAGSIESLSETVKGLDARSEKIGVIVDTIQGIANQTNLLSLNAAIEAARAGEHGLGFAVVADEVRKLAERSAISAGEISDIVRDIRSGITQVSGQMDGALTITKQGNTLAQKAAQSLDLIGAYMADTSQVMGDLVTNSTEVTENREATQRAVEVIAGSIESSVTATNRIATQSNEAAEAVARIASVVSETAASSEEVAASVEEQTAGVEEMSASATRLAELATILKGLVKQFRV